MSVPASALLAEIWWPLASLGEADGFVPVLDSGEVPCETTPSRRIVPSAHGTVPAIAFSSVDLPAPLGPVTNTISPGIILSDTPRSAVRRP